ncbi:MAG: NADH:ubiquinone oxidoreductase [Deltaproteobacteria bacterium]|nr:NADH:ubiquinone oxidoreductase [Deltaproteobacteria bacterium]
MQKTLFWLQCGGCGGDTWSMFNIESPNLSELLASLDIEVLWHPAISVKSRADQRQLVSDLLAGRQRLDFLCIEGAIIRGPRGTGSYDLVNGKPKKDLVAALARQARYVVAVGTCASFGGFGTDSEIEATGMQFLKWEKGGFMGEAFQSKSGHPVINLPGCPCHHDIIGGTLAMLASDATLNLTEHQSPAEWYNIMVHQGCTRNEYHEYRVEDKRFGEKGCMFFHLGCHGPLAHGPCNKLLWQRLSSKTRIGVPCFGCTRPDFPQPYPFFETRNIEGIPIELPEGVNRAHYMAYKGMAAAAAPQRLKTRKTGI